MMVRCSVGVTTPMDNWVMEGLRLRIALSFSIESDLLLMEIEVGLFHSCSLFDSGEVACWGDNSYGQLGDGTQTAHSTPEVIILSTNATSIQSATGTPV